MKDVLDKCSDRGCSIDIGSVLDNENCGDHHQPVRQL